MIKDTVCQNWLINLEQQVTLIGATPIVVLSMKLCKKSKGGVHIKRFRLMKASNRISPFFGPKLIKHA